MTQHTAEGRAMRDYLHCLDCNESFDYWKADCLADTGHDGHALRALTAEEFRGASRECGVQGCDNEW